MSYRELWVFIQHLPQESWTQTILRDQQFAELINPATADESQPGRFGPWALLNYQIAALTDAVNRVWYASAAGKFDKLDYPDPTPRPGMDSRPKRVQSEAAVLYLDRLRARG